MMLNRQKFCTRKKSGFTIIEIIIDIGIISMVATALLSLMLTNVRSASFAQMKMIASNLANQRIEEIRNLPYDQVATEHGTILPQGSLLDSENLVLGGFRLRIQTTAIYVDDPFDGTIPTDTAPYDYKKTTVSVFQDGRTNPLATLTTNISAKAAETPSNTGILLLNVVDGQNNAVEEAEVTITNSVLNPAINITTYTGSFGLIMVPKLPPSNAYVVTVSKTGYSSETTVNPSQCTSLPPAPEANSNPNIIAQQVTNLSVQIRCLVDLGIAVQGYDGSVQPGLWVRVKSSRRRCLNPLITKYDQWQQSDASGNISILQVENDQYTFTNDIAGSEDHEPKPTLILDSGSNYDPNLCNPLSAWVRIATGPTFITVTEVEPRHVSDDYNDSMTIVGTNLDLLTDARFVRSNQTDIVGTVVSLEPTMAVITFNFTGARNGSWDLKLTNIADQVTLKRNAIEIVRH